MTTICGFHLMGQFFWRYSGLGRVSQKLRQMPLMSPNQHWKSTEGIWPWCDTQRKLYLYSENYTLDTTEHSPSQRSHATKNYSVWQDGRFSSDAGRVLAALSQLAAAAPAGHCLSVGLTSRAKTVHHRSQLVLQYIVYQVCMCTKWK